MNIESFVSSLFVVFFCFLRILLSLIDAPSHANRIFFDYRVCLDSIVQPSLHNCVHCYSLLLRQIENETIETIHINQTFYLSIAYKWQAIELAPNSICPGAKPKI